MSVLGVNGTLASAYQYENKTQKTAISGVSFTEQLQKVSIAPFAMEGQGLEDMLKTQYSGLKYHVLDTSKINASLWQRNDYPFEMFFEEELDEAVLDWKPTSENPSMLDAGVQARLNAASGRYAVVVPPALEEKLRNHPELSQSIMDKIATLIKEQDTVPSTIDSFSITLDEDGNISNYRLSSSGGEIMMPSEKEMQRKREEKAEEVREQERKQRLAAKRAFQRKEQLEKAELDKMYQQRMREAMQFYGKNLLL